MTENDKIFKGHPRGLSTLFFSEMWERFCYYGMRTLLTLYLVKSLMKGDAEASLIYGAYTGLVYAAPVLGGRMADRFLGYRYAILLGAILMAIGEFMILGGNDQWLLIGMGAIIVGNGYFKANISTIVGKLYKDGDEKRDSGFTIFYIGINVGALGATTIVAYIGETYGFKYGFALAGIGMLLGFLIFATGGKNYAAADGLDVREAGKKKLGPLNMVQIITIASVLLIPVCYLLIANNEVLNLMFLALFILVSYSLISAGAKEGKIWRDRMIALVIFIVINIVFWACFEQAGTSLTLFADRNVNREILGWMMPASMTQFFNPFFIIVFGSIFSVMWIKLTKIGKNPSIPMKFALGILQLGLGFLLTLLGLSMANSDFQVPLLTLVFLYMLHTTGELFLSPIGLSMVTKLSPKHMAGTAMGGWFLSFAIANLLGGQIAALTGAGHGGAEVDKDKFSVESTVRDAISKIEGTTLNFEDWKPLKEGDAKNVTLGHYMNIQDYVEFRESYDANGDYNTWKANRTANDTLTDPAQWLDAGKWAALGARLEKIEAADKAAAEAAEASGAAVNTIDRGTWEYFRTGFADLKAPEASLSANFASHKLKVSEEGLKNYVHIFSIIGYVLIGIAILIALLSKPLNKLMHGVT